MNALRTALHPSELPISIQLDPTSNVAHHAFDLALISDAPLVLYRHAGFLRWEASLWEADTVETSQATYTYARLRKISHGMTRWSVERAVLR